MTFTWWVPFVAALVPLLVGAVWYNPKVFGSAWMKETGLSEEELRKANMALIFGLTYFFGLLISVALVSVTIHQSALFSLLGGGNNPTLTDPNSVDSKWLAESLKNYGSSFRTFGHGVLHGGFSTLLFIMPIIGINALFERKGFKYIALHTGFWFVCLALMGGIVCKFL